jgi:hypothetical protein
LRAFAYVTRWDYTAFTVNLTKLSQHPVWSNAIGGIIAAAAIALAGFAYRKNWWPAVRRGVSAARAYLLTESSLPHWAVGLLALGVVLLVALSVGVVVIASQAKGQNQNAPDWLSYTKDSFYGLNWVWTYEGRAPRLTAVLCSRCGFQVFSDSTSMFDSSVRFHCDSCGQTVPVQGQSWDSLQSVVMRLIQQKLRNKTYPKQQTSERKDG